MNENEVVKGFKVFNADWTCRDKQYTCPGKFKEEGELDVCGHGMHFCKNAVDCFRYYGFDPNNHVAEVIAHGKVLEDNDKCCTNNLEIVREIPWGEVLRIVNIGKDCTGFCNTGNRNTGDWNTGDWNTGNRNTGDWNTGNRNTGNRNTGNRNTGNRNTGNRNTGNRNTGDWNTGDGNTGDWNTGDGNTGDWNTGNRNTGGWNTGNRNTGDWNTGDRNSGNRNTGDWNKSSCNTGCFMTEEPKISLFNEPSDWSHMDWWNSEARQLLNRIPKGVVEWICSEDMTDKEKAENPTHKTTGGYLKVLNESESAQIWWDSLTGNQKDIIRNIPNYNQKIFEQITGIKTE